MISNLIQKQIPLSVKNMPSIAAIDLYAWIALKFEPIRQYI